MKKTLIAGLILLTTIITYSPTGNTTSFDCSKAKSYSEITICEKPDLSAQDDALFTKYKQAKENFRDAIAFKEITKALWNSRERCNDEACIYDWYKKTNEIYGTLSSNSAQLNSTLASSNEPSDLRSSINTATKSHPQNESLNSAISYIRAHYNDDNYYFAKLALDKITAGSASQDKIKKISIGEACGIAATMRMYLYYASISEGIESHFYKAKAYSDAQRILMNFEDMEDIEKSFNQIEELKVYFNLYGMDKTGEYIFKESGKNCFKDPFSNISSLDRLILNDSVDFSDTKFTYENPK